MQTPQGIGPVGGKPRRFKHCATSWTPQRRRAMLHGCSPHAGELAGWGADMGERTWNSKVAWAASLLAALASSGCGGGSEGEPAHPVRLAAATSPSLVDVDTLLNWGEATYPPLFLRSDAGFTKASPGYDYYYRDYPATGNSLGVSGQDGYVQGP